MTDNKVQLLINACPHCGGDVIVKLEQVKEDNKVLLIKEDKKFVRVDIKDIQIIEAMRDYLKISTNDKCVITHMTMSRMESILNSKDFIRVSRSFIINKSAISNMSINSIQLINKSIISVGINYREIIKKMTETGLL